jgi:CelD/BcsL family acetyltransferase involved in cellulose biosynthesis
MSTAANAIPSATGGETNTADAAGRVLSGLDHVSGLVAGELGAADSDDAPVDVEAIRLSDHHAAALLRREPGLWSEWLALWDALPPCDRDAAAHPAWLSAWLQHYALSARRDMRLFACRAAGELLALLPFEVVPRFTPLGRTCELRLEATSPLEGASLAVRSADLERVCAAIFSTRIDSLRPAAIVLNKVDETHSLLRASGVRCEEIEPRSVIDISAGYDALLAALSSNFRGNLRKARNKLEKLSGVRLDEITAPHEMTAGLARFANVEQRSWKGQEATDLARDAAMHGFYRDALQPLAANGQALIHVLHAAGTDIAAQIALRFGDRLDVHKISFDEQYQDMAPGNLLLEHVMRDAAPRLGITRVNLVTHLPWHGRWNPGVIRTCRVSIFPGGVRGAWSQLWSASPKDRVRTCLDRVGLLEALRALRDRVR